MELELKGITKRFGSLVANDGIDLSVVPGQVHALLGENGAGKTTLMNVLYGLLQPDEGEILLDGKAVRFGSPKDAIAAGIGMVHQHFMLVPVFTVAENVTLGIEETRRLGLLDRRKTRKDVRELSHRYGLEVDPDALVENLPVGIQQRVEIVKALVREATVLILDEPTSVLTPAETNDLFRIIRQLKEGGRSIVFISHKLKEVQAIADTITVLRRGKVVGARSPSATEDELASLMVGRNVQLRVSKEPAKPGDVVLDVADLTVARRDRPDLGERGIVPGPGGRDPRRSRGPGQRADRAVRGADGAAAHDGRAGDAERPRPHPCHAATAARAGVAYVPEDRQADGLVGDFSVADNLVLDTYDRPPFASGIRLNLGAIATNAAERVHGVRRARPPRPTRRSARCPAATSRRSSWPGSSGASTRCSSPSQPTRGPDVGSIEFVHRRIVEQRDKGVAVLIVSAELDEIYALADRIAVMYEGKITGFRPPTVPAEELGLLMAGGSDEAPGPPGSEPTPTAPTAIPGAGQ